MAPSVNASKMRHRLFNQLAQDIQINIFKTNQVQTGLSVPVFPELQYQSSRLINPGMM